MADTTGNDPSLAIKLRSLHKEERKVQLATGITMEMVAYISQANHSRSVPRPTALKVAQLRAVHQLLDTPLVFEDPLALKILVRAERRKTLEAIRGDITILFIRPCERQWWFAAGWLKTNGPDYTRRVCVNM